MKQLSALLILCTVPLLSVGCFIDADDDDDNPADCRTSCDDAHAACVVDCDDADNECRVKCDSDKTDCTTDCD